MTVPGRWCKSEKGGSCPKVLSDSKGQSGIEMVLVWRRTAPRKMRKMLDYQPETRATRWKFMCVLVFRLKEGCAVESITPHPLVRRHA